MNIWRQMQSLPLRYFALAAETSELSVLTEKTRMFTKYSHRHTLTLLLSLASGLLSMTAPGLNAQPTQYSYDAPLVRPGLRGSWDRQFGVIDGEGVQIRRPFVESAASPSIVICGNSYFTRSSDNDRDPPKSGHDIAALIQHPPSGIRYLLIRNLAIAELNALPEAMCASITHLTVDLSISVTAEDLRLLRRKLPCLTALSVSMSNARTTVSDLNSSDAFVVELTQFGDLTELALDGLAPPQLKRYASILTNWLTLLPRLRTLDLGGFGTSLWNERLARALTKLESLRVGELEDSAQNVFWDSISSFTELRCLGIVGTHSSGCTTKRLATLQKLPKLDSLHLGGTITEDAADYCEALGKLTRLRHLTLPSMGTQADWLKPIKPWGLRGLQTLNLPILNRVSATWVVTQTDLRELTSGVIGNDWNDLDGTLQMLSACKNLHSLNLTLNQPPKGAFAGDYSLNIKRLRLSLAVEQREEVGVISLISACPKLEVLILGLDIVPGRLEPSAALWDAVSRLKSLKVLCASLPPAAKLGEMLEALTLVELVYDRNVSLAWGESEVAAVAKSQSLKIVIKPDLSDEMAAKLRTQMPSLCILRDGG